MENYKVFKNFRIDGKLDMHRLHGHSLAFMRYLNVVIEQNDPVFFQNMLFDNHNIHSRYRVSLKHMKVRKTIEFVFKFRIILSRLQMLLEDLIEYVLEKLKDVSSASLRSGFNRLLEKFQFDIPEKSSSIFMYESSGELNYNDI